MFNLYTQMCLRMETLPSKLTWLLLTVYFFTTTTAQGKTRVTVTSPVSPVRERGILSVHCHVVDLTDDHEVTISHRADGKTSRLTWGEGVVTNAEDRVFLAIRQLTDGTVVYFLSITDVVRRDGGEYSCKVFNSEDMKELGADSVDIPIQYFPEEPFPLCTPTEAIVVYSGSSLTLNCTSESGHPHVDMEWIRTGTDSSSLSSSSRRVIQDGVAYTELHLTPTYADNEAVFLCQVSSAMFPDRLETCHVGPIIVIPSDEDHKPSPPFGDITDNAVLPTRKSTNHANDINQDWNTREVSSSGGGGASGGSYGGTDCRQLCNLTSDTYNQQTFTWIVATCVAGLSAIVFCLVGIVISIKLYRLPTQSPPDSPDDVGFHPRECIYEDVESRRSADSKVYMALKTSGQPEKNILHHQQQPIGRIGSDHYAITLCRPAPNYT